MGEIGKAFSKRVKSLSMKIVYFGPNKKNLKYFMEESVYKIFSKIKKRL